MPFTFPCPLAWGCCAGGAALLGAEGPRSPALEGARAPLGIWRGQEKPLHAPCTPQSRTRAAPLCCIHSEGNPQHPFEPLSRFGLECFLGFVGLEKGSDLVLVVLL